MIAGDRRIGRGGFLLAGVVRKVAEGVGPREREPPPKAAAGRPDRIR